MINRLLSLETRTACLMAGLLKLNNLNPVSHWGTVEGILTVSMLEPGQKPSELTLVATIIIGEPDVNEMAYRDSCEEQMIRLCARHHACLSEFLSSASADQSEGQRGSAVVGYDKQGVKFYFALHTNYDAAVDELAACALAIQFGLSTHKEVVERPGITPALQSMAFIAGVM